MKGVTRYGFVVDPGAASALTGTETLRKYYENVLLPRGYKPLNVHQSGATFTGIDGVSEKGVGMT